MKDQYSIRKIELEDFDTIFSLLQDLSKFLPAKSEFNNIWKNFMLQKNVYGFVLIENKNNKLIGYSSISIEIKVRGGKMGHIEDVVIDKNYRKLGLGKYLIDYLTNFAKLENCYKISLECRKNNIKFYESCNYSNTGFAMSLYLN